jgi:hypothetical protein
MYYMLAAAVMACYKRSQPVALLHAQRLVSCQAAA